MIHLVRDAESIRRLSSTLKPGNFDHPLEFEFNLVYDVALAHWMEHGVPIARQYMVADIDQKIASTGITSIPGYDESVRERVSRLLDEIYSFPAEYLKTHEAIKIAQKFLDERAVFSPALRALGKLNSPAMKWFEEIAGNLYKSRISDTSERVDLMNPNEPLHPSQPRTPCGCSFVDEILGGGMCPPEIYVLLGPSGGGKTLLALQVGCEMSRRRRHVMYCSYEQPVRGELSTRVYSYLTGTDRRKIEGKPVEEYDKEFMQKLDEQRQLTGPYLHMFDFQGQKGGFGGMDEIGHKVQIETQEGRPPGLIVIDWIIPMTQRYIAASGKRDSELRMQILAFVDKAVTICAKHSCNMLILNQLSTQASRYRPSREPDWTDSHECKALSHLASFTLALGRKDLDTGVCWLAGSKARAGANISKKIFLDGAFNRFIDVDDKFDVDVRGGSGTFIPKSGDYDED